LSSFQTWLKKHHPEIQLKDLCGTLSPKSLEELAAAEERVRKTIESNQAITKLDSQTAAKRFKIFFEMLKSASEGSQSQQTDGFKR
jgi:hypothetical protein